MKVCMKCFEFKYSQIKYITISVPKNASPDNTMHTVNAINYFFQL